MESKMSKFVNWIKSLFARPQGEDQVKKAEAMVKQALKNSR
jgi:hypothetical protein